MNLYYGELGIKGNPMVDTNLKITFNTAPTLYEEVRPGYS